MVLPCINHTFTACSKSYQPTYHQKLHHHHQQQQMRLSAVVTAAAAVSAALMYCQCKLLLLHPYVYQPHRPTQLDLQV
jgi:maleate cis-trans isomerase